MTSVLTPGVVSFSLTGCFVFVVVCVCVGGVVCFLTLGGKVLTSLTVYFFMVIGVLKFGILAPGSNS